MTFLLYEYWMIANAYPPRTCQRAGSPPPAVLGSAAQSGSDDMLWEAKLVTFSSLWRGVLLAQLVICRKGQATDPAFPQCVWGDLGGAGEPSALQGPGSFHVAA